MDWAGNIKLVLPTTYYLPRFGFVANRHLVPTLPLSCLALPTPSICISGVCDLSSPVTAVRGLGKEEGSLWVTERVRGETARNRPPSVTSQSVTCRPPTNHSLFPSSPGLWWRCSVSVFFLFPIPRCVHLSFHRAGLLFSLVSFFSLLQLVCLPF